MSEAVLSAYTHAMNTCQAAAPQAALKQDYERAKNGYLQKLLVIAADLGDFQCTCSRCNLCLNLLQVMQVWCRPGRMFTARCAPHEPSEKKM